MKSRELLLKEITSQYDLDLFREAQAKACEQIVSQILIFCRYLELQFKFMTGIVKISLYKHF